MSVEACAENLRLLPLPLPVADPVGCTSVEPAGDGVSLVALPEPWAGDGVAVVPLPEPSAGVGVLSPSDEPAGSGGASVAVLAEPSCGAVSPDAAGGRVGAFVVQGVQWLSRGMLVPHNR